MKNLREAKNMALRAKLILYEKGKFNSNCKSSRSYSSDYQKSIDRGKAAQDAQSCVDKSKGERSSRKSLPLDDKEGLKTPILNLSPLMASALST